ncbi:hypothetical protein K438DRAFT_1795606 [Mycena galopus ATCC 62051]|nr:hypothetical protein K438DRAFT_1795606 [Mycena galopus ATCC 62051]
MPLAGISDLPAELLVNITEDPAFLTETLYYLAFLTWRLNYIALPLYFSRSGIDLEDTRITLRTNRHDALSALQICLGVSSMQRVEFVFPHPSSSSEIFPFLKQMKRVETFFYRLTSLKEVVMQFDCTASGRCLALGSDEVLHAWATQLRDLLTCIVERGCTSFTVVNGTHLIEAYQLVVPAVLIKYCRGWCGECCPGVPRHWVSNATQGKVPRKCRWPYRGFPIVSSNSTP